MKIAAVVAVLTGIAWFGVWAIKKTSSDPLEQARSAYKREDWRRAEDGARAVLKTASAQPAALRLLARSLARQGRSESAEAIYRRLGTKFMEAEDYFVLGSGLLMRGQVGPALASLGAARDAQPDHAETLDALSRYWAKTQTMTDAADAALRLSRQPGWEVRGQIRLGHLLADLFEPQRAADALANALVRDPKLTQADLDPAAARRLLVRCLLRSGRPAEARAQLSGSPGPELDPEGSWLLSRAFLQEGKGAEAIGALNRAQGFGASDPFFPEPAPFLGSAGCASCHRAQYQSQQSSRHSRTLVTTGELAGLAWPHGNIPDTDNSQVEHQFQPIDKNVEVITRVENQAFRAVIEFAMGSKHQGRSFLAREKNGQVRELRISEYPGEPYWSRTNEHPAIPPDPPGYLGRPITPDSFRKCLHCHSTDFRAVLEPEGRPEARDHGIGCERCHGPGGNHSAAIAASFPVLAIGRPKLASAAKIVALCGECHTAPAKKTQADPGFVRFQASSLVLSRCFTESGDALSCTTCHDPHKDVETSAAYYESKCLKCHAAPTRSTDGTLAKNEAARSSCRVNSQNGCLDCHMPRIKNPVPRTVFTDHHIKVRNQ